MPGEVHLDVGMQYARYYGTNASYWHGSTLAWGSPGFVLGVTVLQALANASARARAQALAAEQWREACWSRVIVTDRSTWCQIGYGRWLEFAHDAVLEYRVDGWAVVMTFAGAAPLMLAGPQAWVHAVIFARLRFGPQRWHEAPWLHPLGNHALAAELMAILQACQPPASRPTQTPLT